MEHEKTIIEIRDAVVKAIVDEIEIDEKEILNSSNIRHEFAIDSLSIVNIITDIENEISVEFESEEILDIQSVDDIVKKILGKRQLVKQVSE